MPRESKFSLREFRRGEGWNLEIANAVIRAVKQNAYMHHGVAYEDSSGIGQKLQNQPETLQILASETIPPYSIFGVCLSGTDYNPSLCDAKKIGSGGSLLGLFTNGQIQIENGRKAIVETVGYYRPVRVRVTGTTPLVGEPCGVKLDTFGVSNVMQGMVCLSDLHSPGSGFAVEYVWAMRSADMTSVIGHVTVQADAYDIGSQTPGQGTLKIQFRNPTTNALVDAIRPGTGGATWELPFYNFSEIAVSVDLKVRAEATLGVGLSVYETTGGSAAPIGVPFFNNSGETIPPGGVMMPLEAIDVGGVPYIEVVKPTSAISRFWLINGPTPVASLGTSLGSFLEDLVGFVAIAQSIHTTDAYGWGPRPFSWSLWPDRMGFNLLGGYDRTISGQLTAYFKQQPIEEVFGKYYEDLLFETQADFEIWHRNEGGTLIPSGWDKILVWDRWLESEDFKVEKGTFGTAQWYASWWEAGLTACKPIESEQSQGNQAQSQQTFQANQMSLQTLEQPMQNYGLNIPLIGVY